MNKGAKPALTGLEIAVIGMALRFPGARDTGEFWDNLQKGVEAISFFSDRELEEAGIDPKIIADPNYIKAKGLLEDIDCFDAGFFDYFGGEAELLDPQVRIFHEGAWHALEDSGYDPWTYKGLLGLYAGATPNVYWQALSLMASRRGGDTEQFSAEQLSDRDYLCTRISYKLNLRGPAVFVQTACSTSLAAIHTACRALLTGECDMALAGGVTLTLPNKRGYAYQEGMIYSRDGHCRAFDENASGLVPGEGLGIVVLKPLKAAVAAGDKIRAVIKGSALNNDGIRKVGFTAPSVEGQAEVLRAAIRIARVEPESIGYVETHGTGTLLGDPIESEGLKLAFNTDKKRFCAIGSVKTNLGHLDNAAGVASLIKTILALQQGLIPPNLNFTRCSPGIDLENSPFYVNPGLTPWKRNGYPRRAGISSFGVGGTNAHVILEEYPGGYSPQVEDVPAGNREPGDREYRLLLLSAKTATALEQMTRNLVRHFRENPGTHLGDAAYTLQVGRKSFPHRRMQVCASTAEALEKLSSPPGQGGGIGSTSLDKPRLVFMFPGQGAQYVNMGEGLYRTEPVFREETDRCFERLKPLMGCDIKELIYPTRKPDASDPSDPSDLLKIDLLKIDRTEFTQPIIFVFEYALARLLMGWGILPWAMVGHSIGEYTAACLSGVLSLEAALEIVVQRGRLIGSRPAGGMVSVPLAEEELIPLVKTRPGLSLAAVNGVKRCVVSGPPEVVEAFAAFLKEKGHECRKLHTSHAFHSAMLDPVLKDFAEVMKKVTLHPPQIPYISNSSGTWIKDEEAMDPAYWAAHLRKTVRFHDGIKELGKEKSAIFLEVGPGPTLRTLVQRYSGLEPEPKTLRLVRHPREEAADAGFLLEQLGQLWLAGVKIDWNGYYSHEKRRRLALPLYPFAKTRYWLEGNPYNVWLGEATAPPVSSPTASPPPAVTAKTSSLDDCFYIPSWKCSLSLAESPAPPPGAFTVLLFSDSGGLGAKLGQRLRRDGHDVVTVREGADFSRLNPGEYTIHPGTEEHYHRLLDEGIGTGKFFNKILHLWNITGKGHGLGTGRQLEQVENRGFYSLIYLARALGKRDHLDAVKQVGKIRLIAISAGIHQLTGNERLSPGKALISGPCRVIEREYAYIDCRSIDVVVPGPGTPAEQELSDQLYAEIRTDPAPGEANVIAYRGRYRWTQHFEPLRLEENKDPGIPGTRLREKGVYLITGGFGGIGITLAGYLAGEVKAKLVLLGRSALPDREQWPQWLESHEKEDKIAVNLRKIQELENLGAEVLALTADVSDLEQMQAVIRQVKRRFGTIHGVIHSAGLPDGGVIRLRTRELSHRVLAPKVRGTLVLERVLQGFSLDFMVLCSSLAAVVPEIGEVAYVAANAFLDAYAFYKTSVAGTFTVSINWDGWQEVGMAVTAARELAQSLDLPGDPWDLPFHRERFLQPREGVEAFKRILGSQFPQVLVSLRDLATRDKDPGSGIEEVEPVPVQEAGQEYRVPGEAGDSGGKKYLSTFNLPGDHWLLKEHQLMGQSVLPGTAYLELAAAAFAQHTGSGILEILEIYFLVPLMAREHETLELQVELREIGEVFAFSILSRTQGEKGNHETRDERGPREHARGRIAALKVAVPREHNLEAIFQENNQEEVPVKQENYRPFGPRWHTLKKISLGTTRGTARLELAAGFQEELKRYSLHPALLDCATGFLTDYLQGTFIPWGYKNVKIKQELPGRLISVARYSGDWQSPGEFVNLAVTIMAETGTECVEIGAFILRNMESGAAKQTGRELSFGDSPGNMVLEVLSPGILESITFGPAPRRAPGPGEVEIRVHAAGLNFRDVLLALNLSADPRELADLGSECSGEVTAVGEGVTGLKAGDRVMAMGSGCFSQYVTVSTAALLPKPEALSWEEAATLLGAFTTAYYSLLHQGRLCRGERVLIQAAAGGVGMAAVQVAQGIGAEIFATAGSEEKREFLRTLGIKYVMDSRSLAFAAEVSRLTGGQGVDVVLNSLGGGDFIATGLSTLAPYGRFLEIGKRDILENRTLGLGLFKKGLSFISINLEPGLPGFGTMLQELARNFEQGRFKPIPYRVFPAARVAEAFQYMAQARHIGKIVVTFTGEIPGHDRAGKKTVGSQTHGSQTQVKQHYTLSEVETQLLDLCRELLKTHRLGPQDDFFEIGVDSLTLVQFYARINREYPNCLKVQDLFDNRTLHKLAGLILQRSGLTVNPETVNPDKERKTIKVDF